MCRNLKASEIDVRVQSITSSKDVCKGATLLLYKDARVDMDLLDEEYGKLGWQRTHEFKDGKLYCTVSVWDKEKSQWISREDVGTESNTEAEKGQCSDSFKRACTNFGNGRELYTSPFIWIDASDFNYYATKNADKHGNTVFQTKDKFSVQEIEIENKVIVGLAIKNEKTGKTVFTYGKCSKAQKGSKSSEEPKGEQTPTEDKNKGGNDPMTYEKALELKVYVKDIDGHPVCLALKDVYHKCRPQVADLLKSGRSEVVEAIKIIEAEILNKKKNESKN